MITRRGLIASAGILAAPRIAAIEEHSGRIVQTGGAPCSWFSTDRRRRTLRGVGAAASPGH
jgi:hypothetical protein